MTTRGKILSALVLLAPLALVGCSNPNGSPLVTTSAPPATGNPLPNGETPAYGSRTLTMPSSPGGAGAIGAQPYR
ncbi:MAG TPA: hypothetical protein VFO61_00560 [Alphaproteobacteria bacterium]|nr:hypothetical protein [Alphaproteobacteria bacterium]